jgi:uncharacterized protein
MAYSRPLKSSLLARLAEPPKRIQILAGPRQVGKTTLVQQIRAERPSDSIAYFAADASPKPSLLADFNADETSAFARGSEPLTQNWLQSNWEAAEVQAARWHDKTRNTPDARAFVLVLDEIQKIPQWSSLVKGLWDRQIISPNPMHLVLLGSAPLLMQKGLKESLAGRFEVIPMTHWSFEEMNDAFDFSLDEYVYFGGYPGSAPYIRDEPRWRDYVVRGLIEPNIEKDILMMTRVDKPALLKQLFELGCAYSGQIVSLTKIKGQLNDAGNTTTLTGYLELLRQAGLLTGLQKFAANELRKRGSPPKFQVLNNALMSAMGSHTLKEAIADRTYWGRLVESAVGAHLVNTAGSSVQIHYWREGGSEVDFVVERGKQLAAIEVKSGTVRGQQKGLAEFASRHKHCRRWVVGGEELPLGEFLRYPAAHWVD